MKPIEYWSLKQQNNLTANASFILKRSCFTPRGQFEFTNSDVKIEIYLTLTSINCF